MAAHAMRKELEEALSKDGFKSLADYDAKNPKG
jgi:dihydroorotate dehydrogenase